MRPGQRNNPEVQRFRHKREDTLRHIDRGHAEMTDQGFQDHCQFRLTVYLPGVIRAMTNIRFQVQQRGVSASATMTLTRSFPRLLVESVACTVTS